MLVYNDQVGGYGQQGDSRAEQHDLAELVHPWHTISGGGGQAGSE